jgi:hypothetical protein
MLPVSSGNSYEFTVFICQTAAQAGLNPLLPALAYPTLQAIANAKLGFRSAAKRLDGENPLC